MVVVVNAVALCLQHNRVMLFAFTGFLAVKIKTNLAPQVSEKKTNLILPSWLRLVQFGAVVLVVPGLCEHRFIK